MDNGPTFFDPAALRPAAHLRRQGIEPSRHRTDGEPTYHQVRRGVWIPSTVWHDLTPEARHAALVHATALSTVDDTEPVFSHESAAAVWGMPRIDQWPRVLHTTCPEKAVRSSGLVIRHTNEFHAPDRFQGLLLTSAARTVVDLARTTSLLNAVAAADYAVRVGLCMLDEIWDEVQDLPPRSRGRRQAELVADLVDGRSMSPGESLSRCQMFLLNLPRPVEAWAGDVATGRRR